MKGQRIGYIRVSSFDQNAERQLEHVEVDRVFTEKASVKDTQRPQLGALLTFAREGDTVVVHSMEDPIKQKVEKSHRISSKSLFYNPKHEFGASQKSGL
jgi:DNA invertase Pin-like site-specific DNA recombinase